MPYLATFEREAGGCKISFDGSCASQRLSQRLYLILISIKTQRFKRGNELTLNPCLRNPRTEQTPASLKYCLNPSSCCRCAEREEEEERKKEEEEEERKKEEKSQSRLKEEEDSLVLEEGEESFEGRKVFIL